VKRSIGSKRWAKKPNGGAKKNTNSAKGKRGKGTSRREDFEQGGSLCIWVASSLARTGCKTPVGDAGDGHFHTGLCTPASKWGKGSQRGMKGKVGKTVSTYVAGKGGKIPV